MLTRFSVTVDRDIHDLAVILAKERNVPFQHIVLNALEKYYGEAESKYNGNHGAVGLKLGNEPYEAEVSVVRKKGVRLTPRPPRHPRLIEALNTRIQGLESEIEAARSDYDRVGDMNIRLHEQIENLENRIKTQSNDIQYWSNQSKTWEHEINNLQCQKFHLQGSIEALTMVINKLLANRISHE
jgi:hypothetical protein